MKIRTAALTTAMHMRVQILVNGSPCTLLPSAPPGPPGSDAGVESDGPTVVAVQSTIPAQIARPAFWPLFPRAEL